MAKLEKEELRQIIKEIMAESNKELENEKRRDHLLVIREYAETQIDRLNVLFASGLLIFSIGFIDKVITDFEDTNKALLTISWIVLALSLLATLVSHITSRALVDAELNNKEKLHDIFRSTTIVLTYASSILIILGFILMFIFIIIN